MSLALLLAAGLLDRVRGGWPLGRHKVWAHVATWVAAAFMTLLVTDNLWLVAAAAVLIGEGSWARHDNGWRGNWIRDDKPRSWQVQRALRWGILWSAPYLLLGFWDSALYWYLAAAPLGTLIAISVAVRLPAVEAFDLKHGWPWSELIQMPIIGALVLSRTLL